MQYCLGSGPRSILLVLPRIVYTFRRRLKLFGAWFHITFRSTEWYIEPSRLLEDTAHPSSFYRLKLVIFLMSPRKVLRKKMSKNRYTYRNSENILATALTKSWWHIVMVYKEGIYFTYSYVFHFVAKENNY